MYRALALCPALLGFEDREWTCEDGRGHFKNAFNSCSRKKKLRNAKEAIFEERKAERLSELMAAMIIALRKNDKSQTQTNSDTVKLQRAGETDLPTGEKRSLMRVLETNSRFLPVLLLRRQEKSKC